MYKTEEIAGFECNLILSKDGQHIRRMSIIVGEDAPGWRKQDGPKAVEARHAAREAVKAALASDPRGAWILAHNRSTKKSKITVVSRYTSMSMNADGMIERKDDAGRVIGVYRP